MSGLGGIIDGVLQGVRGDGEAALEGAKEIKLPPA